MAVILYVRVETSHKGSNTVGSTCNLWNRQKTEFGEAVLIRYDLHIHMILDGVDFRKAIDLHRAYPCETLIRSRLEQYRAQGITFLRDGGDAWDVSLHARAIAKEYGIDYRTPAFPIYKKGHYGSFIGRGYATLDDYRRLLDVLHEKNADFVKLMISGLIDFSKANTLTEDGLPQEEICRLVELAHREGFAVMLHTNGDRAANAAMDADAESIEHGAFFSQETLLRLARTGTLWVPTLSTIGNLIGCGRYPDGELQPLLRKQQENLAFVAENGGLIGLGTDAGAYRVPHAEAVSHERHYLGNIPDPILHSAAIYARSEFSPKPLFKK